MQFAGSRWSCNCERARSGSLADSGNNSGTPGMAPYGDGRNSTFFQFDIFFRTDSADSPADLPILPSMSISGFFTFQSSVFHFLVVVSVR